MGAKIGTWERRMASGECGPSHSVSVSLSVSLSFINLKNVPKI